MSAPLSIDGYDAQMLDFSDPDVTMNIPGSAEFFAEALMDHDGHLSTTYGEHPSVEVDMEEYVGDNAEYEMADETAEFHRSHGEELLDIEVYDASHAPSPLVPPQPLQPSVDVPIDSGHAVPAPPVTGSTTLPELQGEPQPELHSAALDHTAADTLHVGSSALGDGVSSEALSSELAHTTDAPDESALPVSESHELGAALAIDQPVEVPLHADVVDEAAVHVALATEHPVPLEVTQHETLELATAESGPLVGAGVEEAYDGGSAVQDEKSAEQAPATGEETVNPLHISDGVYIDPPPAVLLSVADVPQPGYMLFNQAEVEGESTGEPHGSREACSVLLESRPTLYYEPLSSVFEALRQDETLLSRIPHSFEGELVLDAYDLQLVISEDNVHSREISLHDLNIIHDGSDFAGPLRLLLRAIVPRFIMRYYAIQEQIQRLHVAAEVGEEHRQEHHEGYEAGEEQDLSQQEEAITSTHITVASDGSEAPLTTDAEESAKEPVRRPEPTDEPLQESYELEDTTDVQEPAVEYHEVTGEATHALEDEDDYEGTNTGNEDEDVRSDNLDADQIHARTAEDTDAAATVTGQGSEFGGEQTEYVDYVQPEEYDERYGEDLPERAGGASPVQYGEPAHYEEEGDQDTSTAVDETQVVLPGSDEDDEDKSTATPVPARAVLEPEANRLADSSVLDESVLLQKDKLISGSVELVTSESTNEAVHEQASGNQEPDTTLAKLSSEVDESDSVFVSILEREADAEFDRTFSAEQNEQQGSIETALQQEPNWDEWDDEDAEGEDEEDWIDPDAASNESSVTLSSKASSKRSYEELDPNEDAYVEDPHVSPGPKRPRVQ